MTRSAMLAGAAVVALTACSSGSEEAAIEEEVTELLMEWSRALPEGRVDDFKALYSHEPGFLWVERGLPLYQSADEIASGIDQVMASGATISNEIDGIEVHTLSPNAAAFSAQVLSVATMQGGSFTFNGIVTGVAMKEGEEWKLFRGHLSEPE